jgi:hypothetical protein
MAFAFPSTTRGLNLDDLDNVSGFDSATAGTPYAFVKTQLGASYTPVSATAAISLAPDGGLELNGSDQLQIKIDNTSGNSGISLTADGISVDDRVIRSGDTMTGDLLLSIDNDLQRIFGCLDLDINESFQIQLGDVESQIAYSRTTPRTPVLHRALAGNRFDVAATPVFQAGNLTADQNTSFVELSMNNENIINLADPVNNQDAVTKIYVDDGFVNITGDTMTGDLIVDGALATTTIGDQGIDIEDGNIAIGRATGGPAVDIQQRALIPGDGIRVRNQGDTIFFQQGINAANNLEIRHTQVPVPQVSIITELRSDLAGNGYISSLNDPVLSSDAATKNYVDNKAYITVFANKNLSTTNGLNEYSFGNGSHSTGNIVGRSGYVCMTAGEITNMGLSSVANNNVTVGTLRVSVVLNGVLQNAYSVTKPNGQFSGTASFGSPLAVSAGDVISFQSRTTLTTQSTIVCILIKPI